MNPPIRRYMSMSLDGFIVRRLEARDATHLRYRIRHRREHPTKTLKEES